MLLIECGAMGQPVPPFTPSQQTAHNRRSTEIAHEITHASWIAPCYYQNRMHAPRLLHMHSAAVAICGIYWVQQILHTTPSLAPVCSLQLIYTPPA